MNAAKEQFRSAELDKQIEDLTSAKQTQVSIALHYICLPLFSFLIAKTNYVFQMQWLKSYQDDLDHLTAEVNNIEDIRDALPKDCFRQLALEPEP